MSCGSRARSEGTRISESEHEDLKRNLEFALRSAFVQTLEAKTVLDMAKEDLDYYDKIIEISRNRLNAGDIAQIDFDRIELLRVQYESEIQTAIVNLRTAKIQLLQLLERPHAGRAVRRDRAASTFPKPCSRSMISGRWPYLRVPICRRRLRPCTKPKPTTNSRLQMARQIQPSAPGTPGTLRHNNPDANQTLGVSVSIPLRIFDRNQGEKKRTQIDIERSREAREATRAQVFSDVDTAYAEVGSNIALLKPYKAKYNDEALRVRDTVTYSYNHGGASLMDFLNAQSDYRQVQLAYAQLIGAYLTAAAQLNLAVGREVIQ